MTETAFWCSVLLVLYAYLGYPCVLALLALFRDRRVQPGREWSEPPRVSFIITAHNE
jgi:hypothetical protein